MSFNRPFRAVPIQVGKHYRAKRRRQKLASSAGVAVVLSIAAVLGGVIGYGSTVNTSAIRPGYGDVVTGCTVIDGDTIRCDGERIRLLGIDAPELPGHCRESRDCAPGDPFASTSSLGKALTGTIWISRFDQDRYGRTLAAVAGNQGDLSCFQLKHRQAIYKPRWDNAHRIARTCPAEALF